VARRAFELALERECMSISAHAKKLMAQDSTPGAVWKVHDYLSAKRKMVDTKYDYRYSVLLVVFARLIVERWLSLDDLAGLGDEKIERINSVTGIKDGHSPSANRTPDEPPENHPRV
jgi:hypothetical protein